MEASSTGDLLRREALQNEDKEDQTESATMDALINENNMPKDKEYVIDKIVHHSNKDGRNIQGKVGKCLSFDDTWEPIDRLPRSCIMNYIQKVHKV